MEKTTVKDTNYIVCTHSTFFCTLLKKMHACHIECTRSLINCTPKKSVQYK